MITKNRNQLIAVMILSTTIGMVGCTKKTKPDESTVSTAPSIDENALGDSDSGKASGLKTVHFPFNSALLDKNVKSDLASNAQILKAKPELKIQIEGHCDQQGGTQYNLSLGERRANSAKSYLTDLGVSSDRISIISYGKERLLDRTETENAYARNRRANFVITSRM